MATKPFNPRNKWYPPARPGKSYRPDFARYAAERQAWIAHNKTASGKEYVDAMREIAQRCGI